MFKEFKNNNFDKILELSLLRLGLIIFPALENSLSQGTDVPTTDKYLLASFLNDAEGCIFQ